MFFLSIPRAASIHSACFICQRFQKKPVIAHRKVYIILRNLRKRKMSVTYNSRQNSLFYLFIYFNTLLMATFIHQLVELQKFFVLIWKSVFNNTTYHLFIWITFVVFQNNKQNKWVKVLLSIWIRHKIFTIAIVKTSIGT